MSNTAWAMTFLIMLPVMALATPMQQATEPAQRQRSPQKAEPPNAVSALTVYAGDTMLDGVEVVDRKRCRPPDHTGESVDARIVSTYPAYGALVPAGPMLLRATFDQPMSPCGFALRDTSRDPAEFVEAPALMSADRRSFLFVIKLPPGADFTVEFNPERAPEIPVAAHFRSQSGGYATSKVIVFRSSIQKRSPSLVEAARLDPLFGEINRMPGKLTSIGVPRNRAEFSKR